MPQPGLPARVQPALALLDPQARLARVQLMARRSAQSVLKRAREQALREKRELKQANKLARAARRRGADDPAVGTVNTDAMGDAG